MSVVSKKTKKLNVINNNLMSEAALYFQKQIPLKSEVTYENL